MIIETKNGKLVRLCQLQPDDFDKLYHYLQSLSEDSCRRFGPHPFHREAITDFYAHTDKHTGYIAIDMETNQIVAYAIVKKGYLEHDSHRLESYGITLDHETNCTFAPSVADAWQSLGVGNNLFRFILSYLKHASVKRIILWGGVQADNDKAVSFYKRHGFNTLGQFHYNGENYDMVMDIG